MRYLIYLALVLSLLVPAPIASAGGSDPCSFYRVQSRGKGLFHYTAEALWACEAIAARKASGMRLTDRMRAVEFALEQYRAAVVASRGKDAVATPGASARERREMTRQRLAEETGMMAALEAVRSGF